MKTLISLISFVLFFVIYQASIAQQVQQLQNAGVANVLYFTENKGQVADMQGNPRPEILFTTGSKGVKLFITAEGIHYQFAQKHYKKQPETFEVNTNSIIKPWEEDANIEIRTHRVFMQFKNANPNPKVITEEKSNYYENYYLPQCQQGVVASTFKKITFKNLYKGIDWVLYSKNGTIKYDLIVHPSANPNDIELLYEGQDSIQLLPDGELKITTTLGTLVEAAPVIFQGNKKIEGSYLLNGNVLSYGIAKYNPNQALTIDPELLWGTYIGTSAEDVIQGSTADNENNIYINGNTYSASGIALNGYINVYSGSLNDAFLVKFDEDGNRLWGTYFGAESSEHCNVSVCDSKSNVFMINWVRSAPSLKGTKNQIDNAGWWDTYIAKFTKDGTFIWSTYYGGESADTPIDAIIDSEDNLVIGGGTRSKTGISKNGYINNFLNSTPNGSSGFFAKFNNDGDLLWASYFGVGVSNIAIDNNDNIFITGSTFASIDSISHNGFQSSYGGGYSDAFVAKFSKNGNIIWSSYYGGDDYETGSGVAADKFGNCYLYGSTRSADNISFNAPIQSNKLGGGNTFLVKFNPTGQRVWGTYVGNTNGDEAVGITVNPLGEIYLLQDVFGIDSLQLVNPFLKSTFVSKPSPPGESDIYIAKLAPNGQIMWSTLFGSDTLDRGRYITLDKKRNLLVTGVSREYKMPEINGFNSEYLGSGQFSSAPFFIKIKDASLSITGLNPQKSSYCTGDEITINYEADIKLNAGNVFTIELSDSSGSFDSPAILGSKSSIKKGEDSLKIKLPYNLPSGAKYTLRLKSSNVNDESFPFGPITIENPKLPINFQGAQAACKGDTTVLEAPLYSSFTYQWYKDGSTINNEKQNTLKTTDHGNYYLLTFTSSGCWAYSDTITINPPIIGAIGFDGNLKGCVNTALAFTDTSTFTGSYTRRWKSSFDDTSNLSEVKYTFTSEGTYQLTLHTTDANSCKDSLTKTIEVFANPNAILTTDKDTLLCPGDSIEIKLITESENTILWEQNSTPFTPIADTLFITHKEGIYKVTVENLGGCKRDATVSINIINPPAKTFIGLKKSGIISTPFICTDDNETIELSTLLQGTNYLWEPSNTTSPQYVATDTGKIYLTVSTNNGCSFKDSVNIQDGCPYTLFIPNAFTPNKKDDYNPIFKPIGTNIIKFNMKIFNKWGGLLFETNDINNGWDGKYKDEDVPAGVYFYLISFTGKTKKGILNKGNEKGTITLIR